MYLLDDGVCVTHPNPDLWFTDGRAAEAEAKRLCGSCPVVSECHLSIPNDQYQHPYAHGVWAGTTAKERIASVPGVVDSDLTNSDMPVIHPSSERIAV